MLKFLTGGLVTLILLAAVGFGIVWTGAYDVAASTPHAGSVYWALDTNMRNSVERQAEGIDAPADFPGARARDGFEDFDGTCVQCHGAPGVERAEWVGGLRPMPPSLAEAAPEWSAAEVFWIVKNGIKMSAMPAMGASHSDEKIWNIVAFVKQLPDVDAARYAALRAESGGAADGEGDAPPDAAQR